MTNHGCFRAIKSRTQHGGSGKTFLYRFDCDTQLNVFKLNHQKKGDVRGAAHSDDLFYIFKTKFSKAPAIESNEFRLLKAMVGLWTSFATAGTLGDEEWQPVEPSEEAPKCLCITNDSMKLVALPDYERLRVWNEVYNEAGMDLA